MFKLRSQWKSTVMFGNQLLEIKVEITCTVILRLFSCVAMDRERTPCRAHWSSTVPPPPVSWQNPMGTVHRPQTRPTVMQPQNLSWNPNPCAARIMNVPVAPQVPEWSPNPCAARVTNVQVAPQVPGMSTAHQGPGSTRHRTFGPMLPAEFSQNPNYLDSRSIAGLNLARWVKKSEWTVKKQIDGCPSHAIPLHSVLYQGWNSYWIRHVAEGKPTFFVGFRSMAEVVFCHSLFAKLREENVDLDELARVVHGGQTSSSGSNLSDARVQATQTLATKVVDFMSGLYPQDEADPEKAAMVNQIQLLQQQLARFESVTPTKSENTEAGISNKTPTSGSNDGGSGLPIEVGSPEPKPDLAPSAVKGPDGSTRLLRGSSQETRSGLMQAFQKGKAPECSGEPHVVSDSKPLSAKPTQVDNKLEYGTASHVSHTVRNVDPLQLENMQK